MSDSHKLGCALAISAAKSHMSQLDDDVVSKAMSTRMHQMQRELEAHRKVDPATWVELVVSSAYKVLGFERTPMHLHTEVFIKCNTCNLKSFNQNDIDKKFCGHCNKWHESAADYEVGPTLETAECGFSWIDHHGASWHCSRNVHEHELVQCPSCVAIIDDPIGPAQNVARETTPADMILMVTACRECLSLDERKELHRAITDHCEELIAKLMPHGGKIMSTEGFAQLVLSCARDTLKQAEEKVST